MVLPKDPYILLSFLNAKLRDEYPSLEELCASLDAEESAVRTVLEGLDYRYDPAHNQFIAVSHSDRKERTNHE